MEVHSGGISSQRDNTIYILKRLCISLSSKLAVFQANNENMKMVYWEHACGKRHLSKDSWNLKVTKDCHVFYREDNRELQGPGKRGHIVADTLLPMMFLGRCKLGNICCGHKMFLNKIRNIFCVPDTKFVSATNVARAGKRGNICVGNNVSSFARALRVCSLRNI